MRLVAIFITAMLFPSLARAADVIAEAQPDRNGFLVHDVRSDYQAGPPKIRQETYFVKVVVPFVEKQYPAQAEPGGRLLVGFSKSGWGAYSLLLRHPDVFGKAAAWDAPLTMTRPQYGMADIVGTPEQFE